MPADIRSFFGGKTSPPIREKATNKEEDSKKKRGRNRKVVDDSDEEPTRPKKATPKPSVVKKPVKKESPKDQEITTEDYFASTKSKPKPKPSKPTSTPTKSLATPKIDSSSRSSARKNKPKTYSENLDQDELAFLDDDEDAGDDILAANVRKGGREKDAYVEIDSDDEPMVAKPKKPVSKNKAGSKKDEDVEMKDIVMVDDSDDMVIEKPAARAVSKKRKSVDLESEEDDDVVPNIKPVKGKSSKQPPAKKRAPAKKAEKTESAAVQAILNNIPLVRPPTPPKDENAKFDWRKAAPGGGNASAAPPAQGSKEIPEGAENCLVGLTFVFTGLLETLSRDDGTALVKRYGGKVTGAPSGRTDFVVLGADAGPSKIKKIHDLKIKTVDEDGLFALIATMPANGGDGKAAEQSLEKKAAEMAKIKREAEAMEKEELKKAAEAEKARNIAEKLVSSKGSTYRPPAPRPPPSSSLLWTSKYAPTQINQICGNKGNVENIQSWLKGWSYAHKYNHEKRGPDGLGGYRAIMISGPPGIGKTTAAHLAAKLAGYDVLESNASDTRSKKLVDSGLTEVLNNTSMVGFYTGDGKSVDAKKKNILLIMDEVDGMSAGDRGGVGALAKLCKTTDIPMVLICNERGLPKMKPFDHVVFDIKFQRPTVEMIRSRIATICHREGLKLPMPVIDALIEGSNKDIRQIINMISTAKLDQTVMDFDEGKAMSKAWEKSVVLKPWDICGKILSGGMFAPSSKATLNDKIELYFNDHDKSFLMVQENYLSTKPILAANCHPGREQRLKTLELIDKAAESISDGDLVDRMIHGSQQQWSLMPVHGVFSTVRPASFISGMPTGRTNFTAWLGNNSKQTKLVRYVKEIQSHMRLRTSGDRHEIRQQYLPVLWTQLIDRLQKEGKDCVEEVINLMDSYFLTREDFDFIMELGLGPQDEGNVKIESQTKATFTRLYNQKSHPLPFMKAGNITAPTAKVKAEKPDIEEALEDDDEEVPADEPKAEEDLETMLKKDKYIKQPKVKKSTTKTASKKKAVKGDDTDMDSEEEVKPKKAKAKVKPKGKGKK
ncbi:hypothetical protein HYALB_00009248 [Hymenoscyphus albidus]|uniref:Replication factor C subunit 1 n=1 Tax=Hymenoscyphus albidus TaxID=595503 RepID=A0A9N9Q9G5_9HELO|nr:hypothetical protein HYALB_00009248 [Hymenoscyphus albidus]